MPTSESTFIDTNIIIYAHDKSAGLKHRIAAELIEKLWEQEPFYPSISIQVLQETYVNLLKKNVSAKIAVKLIRSYLDWNVIVNDSNLLLEGIRLRERLQLSLWDALLIATSQKAQVKYILTEDLNPQQTYEGIKIINPFIKP